MTESVTFTDRLAGLANAGNLYLQNLLLPLDLRVKYDIPIEGAEAPFPFAKMVIVTLVLAGLLLLTFYRNNRSTSVGIGLFWVFVTLAPVSGIVPSPRFASDSYLYVALPGLCWAIGGLVQTLPTVRPRLKGVAAVAVCVVLVALLPVRISTAEKWRDGVQLWEATYQLYPDSPRVCRSWGVAHMFGRPFADSPEESTSRAAVIFQRCMETLGHREMFVGNLGVVHFSLGNLDASRGYFLEALSYDPDDTRSRNYLQLIDGNR